MTIEDGEIEDGEVPEEEGELRDTDDEERETEKRKANQSPTGHDSKRPKIEDPEEGELSEDGEINSPEPMDMNNSKDLSDGEIGEIFSKVDFFPEKIKKQIDWDSILPSNVPRTQIDQTTPTAADLVNPLAIFKRTQLKQHMSTLIRDEKLKQKIESVFNSEDDSSMSVETPVPPDRSSLEQVLRSNRRQLNMPLEIPIRPFMTPNRIRGELSNRVTHFVLSQRKTK